MRPISLVVFFLVSCSSASATMLIVNKHNVSSASRFSRSDSTLVEKFDDLPDMEKRKPGKHLCAVHKDSSYPTKTKQVYCKPILKTYREKCFFNQICTKVRVVYERAYRDVVTTKHTKQLTYECCQGWTRVNDTSQDCDIPICLVTCKNGGTCIKPNKCHCVSGFAGKTCEHDIDECKEKPCDQICHNTHGSYRCECRESFKLKEDGQSCVKDFAEETEIEGSDVSVHDYENRILSLEKTLREIYPAELKEMQENYKHLEKQLKHMDEKFNQINQYKHDMHKFKNMLMRLVKRTERMEEHMKNYDRTKINYV